MAQRVGLYGGSFNPIHHGHLVVARAIAEQLDLDSLIFLPSARPPHKEGEQLANPAHRAAMVELAIDRDPLFAFSDFDMTRDGPSYTIDTVAHFRREFGQSAALHWIIGADSLAELATWRRVDELVDFCRIITAGRSGFERISWDPLRQRLSEQQLTSLQAGVLTTPIIEISATDIRGRIRGGRSIRYLVPLSVCRYIEDHALYREPPPAD